MTSSALTSGRMVSALWLVFLWKRKEKNISDIMPDPGGHRPQRPYAQGLARAKQDQAQASAPRQNQARSVDGATMNGQRFRQACETSDTRGEGQVLAWIRDEITQDLGRRAPFVDVVAPSCAHVLMSALACSSHVLAD